MAYKVFLVEDEIVTREGIRDNVDWKVHGFEFCGEASDGEVALPLLQTTRPDVLITDIRMPFMDGLQLSRIVRDRMPTTKIIILSGHDEFEYAQKAIKLGVSEYLLKPISVQDVHSVLQKVASELEQESSNQQALQRLRDQVEENRAALRERFLLKLVTGVASSAEAIEKGQLLGIDLVARCYLVVIIRFEPSNPSESFDYRRSQEAQQLAWNLAEHNPDIFLMRKDMEDLVLLLKGSSPEILFEERDLLLARIGQEVARVACSLTAGSGAPQGHIADICHSFMEAMDSLQAVTHGRRRGIDGEFDKTELLMVDGSAVEEYLRTGTAETFDAFFESFIHPLGITALGSSIVVNYMITDIVLATAKLVDELGGDVDQVVPELDSIEAILAGIETAAELREQARKVLVGALAFRDSRVKNVYAGVIRQAQETMDRRYMEPELSLNDVAAQVNLSSCHFSAVFSQETGQTFKEYLTELRIRKAKELLRTTPLKAFEVCYQVGYNDPHYFSHVFRKHTGLTPSEFRSQTGVPN